MTCQSRKHYLRHHAFVTGYEALFAPALLPYPPTNSKRNIMTAKKSIEDG
jgi:hypothetical protein